MISALCFDARIDDRPHFGLGFTRAARFPSSNNVSARRRRTVLPLTIRWINVAGEKEGFKRATLWELAGLPKAIRCGNSQA
jgi:hypothetical protein